MMPTNNPLPFLHRPSTLKMGTIEKPTYANSIPLVSSTFDLLAAHLHSDDHSSTATAKALNALYTSRMTDVESFYNVGYLWGTFFHISKQLPPYSSEHWDLFDILFLLRRQPPPEGPGRSEFEENFKTRFWKDLPYLNGIFHDYTHEAPLHPPMSERPGGNRSFSYTLTKPGPWRGTTLNSAEWASLNALLAKLHASTDIIYLDLRGLSALLDALEEPHVDPKAFDDLVPAAAMWILFAGERIKGNDVGYAKHTIDVDQTKRLPWSRGALWTGERGFSDARWEFWKARFEVLAERDDVESETRNWARKAEIRMSGIDEVARS